MATNEIVLPITRPETEWLRGRARQKMSPTFDHSRVQVILAARLEAWGNKLGRVGTEWRFRVAPPGEVRRPLVPDLSFVRLDRLRSHDRADIQAPEFAPDIAFEILSPGYRRADVNDKVDVLLRSGSELVVVVDPAKRTVRLHDAHGEHSLDTTDVLRHIALPGFELELAPFFSEALDFA